MSYEGYLLKIGNWPVPNDYIAPETYEVGVNKELLKKWKDYKNETHPVYATTNAGKVTFRTAENFPLSDIDVGKIQEALESARVTTGDLNKNAYSLTFYNPSADKYETGRVFILDDLQYTINKVGKHRVFYNPIEFTFSEVAYYDG